MIDHLAGRPSPSWKRTQVFLVILFWTWRILCGSKRGPKPLRALNDILHRRFSPWQIVVGALTGIYAARNVDKILGLPAPEPLASLYSPAYYRATWIATGLDAGFATAMSIKPKPLRQLCSVLFSAYYIIYASEGDEKLRKFRAVPTVEMFRATWEKTTNPILQIFVHLPRISIVKKILIPRPPSSTYSRPIASHLFFAGGEAELAVSTELILDFPGGGFVAMSPLHHQERLRAWATTTNRPVLSIDYGKAPEYPYPFAIDEAYDTYCALINSLGSVIGMSGRQLTIILTGDSAGGTMAVTTVIKILEHNREIHEHIPLPCALVLNYAALDFNFTSWMTPENLRILRTEQSSGDLPGLHEVAQQKDHLKNISPLSMVRPCPKHGSKSWKSTWHDLSTGERTKHPSALHSRRSRTHSDASSPHTYSRCESANEDKGTLADESDNEDELTAEEDHRCEEERPLLQRVHFQPPQQTRHPVTATRSAVARHQELLSMAVAEADSQAALVVGQLTGGPEPIGAHVTMTSRTGYFQDRIISPSMMRAMAILYIGPNHNPDFAGDYLLSPILTPDHLLAQFPPLLMQCGEKDPFVDDTVLFAGRVRAAKRARKAELDLALAGKSASFGESLRMSMADTDATLRKERDRLTLESQDDWVHMVLFSDWSHGYLQMPAIMAEAKTVIEDTAQWMTHAFEKCPGAHTNGNSTSMAYNASSETETDDTGLTFVSKKHARFKSPSPPKVASPGSSARTTPSRRSSEVDTPPAERPPDHIANRIDLFGPLEGQYEQDGHTTGPMAKASDATASMRPVGQIITESELMRRRRLLDTHIYE
ncbi:alpha/beta-hydrolase [Fistulina hepatica ATCC 64428]|uniref:Alpha/beta-hydrolase n=1 Tax=Fistulina hepatica ATCC 64428 TaxID=1128425 RepID=A0A0D7AH67_9AGAR|nr:alpha/beta-hydrolase [Fistulina hepatica ATCC 64428]